MPVFCCVWLQMPSSQHVSRGSPVNLAGKVSWIDSSPGRAPGTVVTRAKNEVGDESAFSPAAHCRKVSGASMASSRLELTGAVQSRLVPSRLSRCHDAA